MRRRWRSLVVKEDFGEVYSDDTFNRLSLTTRCYDLKPLERQKCATLGEITYSIGGEKMSNLHFELFLEKMDWNTDDFKSDVTHLKSYKIPNVL
ncbi:hypothetical protein J2T13_005382 [Paenibacillus sp. DS2015]|uniref:hypothetical protein n=1 Tax=Paenibacillus sp. DS2015 TaxID=3373917 RepID=UPI003D1974FC